MKIAIVTHPLQNNYGGLLQNWALQKVLKKYLPGCEVITFDQVDSLAPWYLRYGSKIKSLFIKRNAYTPTAFDLFRQNNIVCTKKARSYKDFKRLDHIHKPDVYIVGSDQVWRPSMVFKLKANFLGFTKCTKKIAYAASFGIDRWEFTENQTMMAKQQISKFKAVSVREDDGVKLCRDFLDCTAEQVLDPTLLLDDVDYMPLSKNEKLENGEYIFTYILDSDENKKVIVEKILHGRKEINAGFDSSGNAPRQKMSVEQWLSAICNAETVLCDSFHGAAFSIIFNKDFVVINNENRGNSRLRSLLNLFGLNDRLICEPTDMAELRPVDWDMVNDIRKTLVFKSLDFINSAIS